MLRSAVELFTKHTEKNSESVSLQYSAGAKCQPGVILFCHSACTTLSLSNEALVLFPETRLYLSLFIHFT